jgi:hypothetical protein
MLLLLPSVAGVIILSGVTDITGGSDFTGDAVCLTAPGKLGLGDGDLDLDLDLDLPPRSSSSLVALGSDLGLSGTRVGCSPVACVVAALGSSAVYAIFKPRFHHAHSFLVRLLVNWCRGARILSFCQSISIILAVRTIFTA